MTFLYQLCLKKFNNNNMLNIQNKKSTSYAYFLTICEPKKQTKTFIIFIYFFVADFTSCF